MSNEKVIFSILLISPLYSENIDHSKTIILKGGNNAKICSPSYTNSPISDSNITVMCRVYKQKIIDISNNTKKEFERMINENIDNTSSKFKDIKNTIQQIGDTIKVLKTYQIKLPIVEEDLHYMQNKILRLEDKHKKDMEYLESKNRSQDGRMEEIEKRNEEQDDVLTASKNHLLNLKINTGIDFLYPNQLNIGGNIEFKNYNTNSQSSYFLKLSYFKLTEKTNYATLGNNSEEIDNDKKLYSMDLGYREFFDSHRFIKKSDVYLGASLGGTYIDDDKEKDTTWSASLLVGLEYDNQFIYELGCKYLYEVSSSHINFDGLGQNNISSSSEDKFIPFISIKLLWK